ncbi:hypothetical protein EYR40_010555 [Pleurotus pulmonarius]|nr:hypothetical protein EYR36_010059 [Pleurotus pulmonarius]KAF4588999.1 hypothetical protein EYR40_010555 [Pleurotus pulmonarius]
MTSHAKTLEEFDERVPLRARLEAEWLARWPINPDSAGSKTYTREQEVLLISFLPEYIITEPGSDERRYWKAKLVLEWVSRWPLTGAHKKMFSTWFRNHAESLGHGKAAAEAHLHAENDGEAAGNDDGNSSDVASEGGSARGGGLNRADVMSDADPTQEAADKAASGSLVDFQRGQRSANRNTSQLRASSCTLF